MDEATASIDYATDSKIQETIRELTSTIITIVHRLQTIVDYDKVLVLDKGSIVEYGHPWELISDEKGASQSQVTNRMRTGRQGIQNLFKLAGSDPDTGKRGCVNHINSG